MAFRGRMPLEFDPGQKDAYDKFVKWRSTYNNYMLATELSKQPEDRQLAILYNIAGEEFRQFAKKNCKFGEGPAAETAKNVLIGIEIILKPQRRHLQYRCKLLDLKQGVDQPIQEFLQALRSAYDECGYTDATLTGDLLLRDLLIRGIQNADAKRLILQQDTDTLLISDCVKLVSTFETTLTGLPSSETAALEEPRCKFCGRRHARGNCPAYGQTCTKCNGRNHFYAVCKAPDKKPSTPAGQETRQKLRPKSKKGRKFAKAAAVMSDTDSATAGGESEDDERAYAVTMATNGKRAYVDLWANGDKIQFLIDPGTTSTMVPLSCLQKSKDFSELKNRYVRPWNSRKIKIIGEGTVRLAASASHKPVKVTARTVAGTATPLLSYFDYLCLGGQPLTLPGDFDVKINAVADQHEALSSIGSASIQLRSGAQPVVQGARKLAFRMHDAVSSELDAMEKKNIIERVRGPTKWLSPVVIAWRKNGKPRICGDFRRLNENIRRERFVIPTPDALFAHLHNAAIFSTLDLESGFNQVMLDEASSYLTTIATHKGNYRYLRLPFGISSAPEIFQRVMSDHLADLPGCVVYIDDVLVYGKDQEEHDKNLQAVKDRLTAIGAKLNLKKCQFGKRELVYLGHKISANGVSPDHAKITEALGLPPPTTVAEARRLLGMVNYLQRFLPDLASIANGIRGLLKGTFDAEAVETSWNDIKAALKQAATKSFAFYDPKSPVAILADASPYGLGAVLMQKHDDAWKPVMTASRSLTKTEQKYSHMEKEMLALVFGTQRFRQFILGGEVELWSDHKPLQSIWTKPFDDVPPRLQRMLLRLAPYGATIHYHAARELLNCLPDTLSRAPSSNNATELTKEDYNQIAAMVTGPDCLGPDFLTLDDVSSETVSSNALSAVLKAVQTNDWSQLPETLDRYAKERHLLTIHDSPRLLLRGTQIVTPLALREQLIQLAHDSHLGVKATQAQLASVWWPGINADVKAAVEQCEHCREFEERWPELPLQPSDSLPPWHTLATDIFHVNQKPYLSVVDYGSRYPEVFPLRKEETANVVDALDAVFSRFGPPIELMSDNGSQFTSSDFKRFCRSWGIRHRKSAPRYARANGMVERFHRTFKRRWYRLDHVTDKERLRRVLLTVRTTYHRTIGTSPLHALTGRQPRTAVPSIDAGKVVNVQHQAKVQALMKIQHDRGLNVTPLPQPNEEERVTVKDGRKVIRAEVVASSPRRVTVRTETGQELVRPRSHVRTTSRPSPVVTRSGRVVKPPIRFDPSGN